jgi:hypothetical protein
MDLDLDALEREINQMDDKAPSQSNTNAQSLQSTF